MSKFDFLNFYGGDFCFAVSKQKFSKKEAVKIAIRELGLDKCKDGYLVIGDCYVRYRYGYTEDGPCSGWWLEYERHKRSCPCFGFYVERTLKTSIKNDSCEYLSIRDLNDGKLIL